MSYAENTSKICPLNALEIGVLGRYLYIPKKMRILLLFIGCPGWPGNLDPRITYYSL
jgi:hypothetical protein